jgi:adenylylsulfate kinase
MPSTYQRSFIKGMVWELFTFVVTLIAVYWVYGNIYASLRFSFWLTIVKMFLFFFHERLWKRIGWGKY